MNRKCESIKFLRVSESEYVMHIVFVIEFCNGTNLGYTVYFNGIGNTKKVEALAKLIT